MNDSSTVPSVAVCTLWEGDYHKGLAALVNSLDRAGFHGKVWAGYRGPLPEWARGGVAVGPGHTVTAAGSVEVHSVQLDTAVHLSQYKPEWCKRVLQEFDPAATGLYYFDPDILVLTRWTFFEDWLEVGIAVCEDGHYPMNPSHPQVARWQAYAVKAGFTVRKPAAAYINSGQIGLKREYLSFLDDWQHILATGQREFKLDEFIETGTRADLFHNIDQDALNIVLWTTPYPVSWVGVDGMSFDRGEWLTLHATGKKPWRRRALLDLLTDGIAPDRALRRYWQFVSAPIRIESESRVRLYRRLIPFASFLGRFYRRW